MSLERLPETVPISVGIPEMTATLVERTDKKALYLRWDGYYEVFRIKVSKEREMFGKVYPLREVYPGNEDFGVTAWTFRSEKSARDRYEKI